MRDDPSAAHEISMQRHMLICCGMMTVVFGVIAVSSVAATFGLAIGQTYLVTAGFIGISVGVIAYLYRSLQLVLIQTWRRCNVGKTAIRIENRSTSLPKMIYSLNKRKHRTVFVSQNHHYHQISNLNDNPVKTWIPIFPVRLEIAS